MFYAREKSRELQLFYQTVSATIRQQQRGDDKQVRMAERKDICSVRLHRLSACRVHRLILQGDEPRRPAARPQCRPTSLVGLLPASKSNRDTRSGLKFERPATEPHRFSWANPRLRS